MASGHIRMFVATIIVVALCLVPLAAADIEAPGAPPGGGSSGGGPSGGGSSGGGGSSSSSDVSWSGATTITTTGTVDEGTYSSTTADQNALLVDGDGITVTIGEINATKNGDSDGGDNCNFYGINSAVTAKGGATLYINGGTVTADAKGANGVFSYGGNGGTNGAAGDGTTIHITGVTITTTGDNAGGIMTTGGGVTYATDLTVTTSGQSSAALRTDRGGGTVTAEGGTYTSNGLGSPAIYCTADITCEKAEFVSNLSEGVCIEGLNSVTLNDCSLTAKNTKTNGQATFLDTIMIYQSMSGDSSSGTSSFTMTGGTLTSNNGHVFHVTNTDAVITLSGVTIVNNDSDGILLSVCDDGWSGASNIATLYASGQTLSGTILVGSDSTLTMSLADSSAFTGTFSGSISNASGESVSTTLGTVSVTLDSSSTWTLTDDTYIGSFSGTLANVYSGTGGYSLYVNNVKQTISSGTPSSDDDTYTITITSTAGGSVSMTTIGEVVSGTSYSVDGSTLTVGSTSVTATASTGYSFSGWSVSSGTVTSDMTISAVFTMTTYTVTLSAGTGGTVSVSSLSVTYGTAYSVSGNILTVGSSRVTATASTGYSFSGWDVTSGIVTSAMEISASFTPNSYTVTIAASGGGSVSQDTVVVTYGTAYSVSGGTLTIGSITIVATPDTGYTFSGWSISSGTVASEMTITATFSQTSGCTVTIAVDPSNGGTVSSSSVQVSAGTAYSVSGSVLTIGSSSIIAVAGIGYAFSGWSVSSGTVDSDMSVTASFELNSYTVTFSATEGGSVSPASVTVSYGSSISVDGNVLAIGTATVTATPSGGYSFSGWSVSSGTVTSAMTIEAGFSAVYDVTYSSSDASRGTVSTTDGVSGLSSGDKVVLTLTPVEGNELTALTANGTDVLSGISISDDGTITYTVTVADKDVVVVATFMAKTFVVSYSDGIEVLSGDDTIASGSSVVYGTVLTVTADGVLSASVGEIGDDGSYTVTADVTFTVDDGKEYSKDIEAVIVSDSDGVWLMMVSNDGNPIASGKASVSYTYTVTKVMFETTVTGSANDGFEQDVAGGSEESILLRLDFSDYAADHYSSITGASAAFTDGTTTVRTASAILSLKDSYDDDGDIGIKAALVSDDDAVRLLIVSGDGDVIPEGTVSVSYTYTSQRMMFDVLVTGSANGSFSQKSVTDGKAFAIVDLDFAGKASEHYSSITGASAAYSYGTDVVRTASVIVSLPALSDDTGSDLVLTVDGKEVQVEWDDNDSVSALKALAADTLTIQMHAYGGFEQTGSMDQSIVSDDSWMSVSSGDIVLYRSIQICLYFGDNEYNFTHLGKITGMTEQEITDMLDVSGVTAVLSIA